MIPKKIHYCWFGGNPLPELAIKCIESWKKYCPDYEIIEWNESNFDIGSYRYAKEAYDAKKWAFVSDYARFDIIYNCGGVYFDTDVELIKPIDDILKKGAFMGCERNGKADGTQTIAVNPGLGIAAPAGLDIYKKILEEYKSFSFVNPDGTLNTTTVVKYTTDILTEYGLMNGNTIQNIAGIYIYPEEYFCPISYETGKMTITENTRSIHHFSQSWISKPEQFFHWLEVRLKNLFGSKVAHIVVKFIATPYRAGRKVKEVGIAETVKYIGWKVKRW